MPKRPNPFLPAARRAARVVRQVRADDNDNPHRHRAPQATRITSLNGIAVALNARGVQTPAGRNCWHATQVRRVLARLSQQRSPFRWQCWQRTDTPRCAIMDYCTRVFAGPCRPDQINLIHLCAPRLRLTGPSDASVFEYRLSSRKPGPMMPRCARESRPYERQPKIVSEPSHHPSSRMTGSRDKPETERVN
jgi:hypothetical protein